MSVEVIMRKLGYSSRATYYRHIESSDLSLDILKRYAKVLHYNFGLDLNPELFTEATESPQVYLPNPETLEEAINQRDFYWRKYHQQLEEYRKLLIRFEALGGG